MVESGPDSAGAGAGVTAGILGGDHALRGWIPSEERYVADHIFPKVANTVFRLTCSFSNMTSTFPPSSAGIYVPFP